MLRALSILLVEDDPTHVALVRRGISNFDNAIRLTAVSSIEEARRYLRHLSPDIAIVDLNLPDGLGTALLEESHKFPIVILTSHDDEETATLSLASGAAAYVVKDEEVFKNLPQIVLKAHQAWRTQKQPSAARLDQPTRISSPPAAAISGAFTG